ncbi:unnamed protein product [Clonostachys solani]|uniref:Delta 8-(E)-sphingolipid desaturase n=1 Tax=Clonostachys solani TaxID=160281 RepID=A0A9N9ZM95_9HYPO|nr:unnamed protein product [Clonostachys solani]
MGRDDIVSPCQVKEMIAEGKAIVIMDDYVLRLDSWLNRHPGGDLVIKHMIGRDATHEITVYHSAATVQKMKAFRIGRKPAGPWPNMTPPIRGGIYTPSETAKTLESDDDEDLLSHIGDGASSATSAASSSSSIADDSAESLEKKAYEAGLAPDSSDSSAVRRRNATADASRPAPKIRHLSPTEYTDWAMQRDVGRDLEEYPSVEPILQQDIAQKYGELHQKIVDMGYYNTPYLDYGKECARYFTLFAAFIVFLRWQWFVPSAICLGLFWHQIMFSAHDSAHTAITHNFNIDTFISLFIADFCCGLSIGWWKSSHNVHHLITNQPEHDPDIQNLPFFATCPSFFKSLHSTYYDFTYVWDKASEILVPFQKYTYYPVMGIARFNLYLLSWLHVLGNRSTGLGTTTAWWIRPTEITFMACYWFLFGYVLCWRNIPTWTARVVFILVSHVITMPLHVQITLSHWGMSTSDLGESESFAQRQLRTTMDVDCPAWMDFVHGGLQFQVIHHLFPRVPRHNLRKVQALVRVFCQETGIPYSILTFTDGNKKVLGHLDKVGEQVSMLVKCQQYMAETGESGLH